jgi:hypothetical protein
MKSFICFTVLQILRSFKEVKAGGTCSMQCEMRNTYTIVVGKPDEKRPLGETWAQMVGCY